MALSPLVGPGSMQYNTVIKWTHRIVTLSLLMIIIVFLMLNHKDSEPEMTLKRTWPVNHQAWLYMTEQSDGGATVPRLYRYYLTDKISGSDDVVLKKLSTITPVISGSGTITRINIDEHNRASLTFTGNILSVSDKIQEISIVIPFKAETR